MTVGTMLVEEPTPTLPTRTSCLNRSSMFLTAAARAVAAAQRYANTGITRSRLFRRALLHQRGGSLVVAFFARQQILQPDQIVVVVERDQMLLARRQSVALLEHAQHVAHRVG